MLFNVLTIFPDILDSYINKGMLRVAQEKKLAKFKFHNLRDQAVDKHGTVDDRPFGGGPGQVFMIEPIYKTLKKIKRQKNSKVILMSAKGKKWNQQLAQKFSKQDQLIFICPRYEGVDERVKDFIDEEISIGDYILTGGELSAMVVIDSVTRLIPGVLGKQESLDEESHSTPGYLEYPQYTRPEVFEYKEHDNKRHESKEKKQNEMASKQVNENAREEQVDKQTIRQVNEKRSLTNIFKQQKKKRLIVPEVLLSGHHANIEKWRKENSTKPEAPSN